MKIIALIGPSSCGKTSTLNLVYDKIIDKSTIVEPKKKLGGDNRDFSIIITYEGFRIAIFTMGDYSFEILKAVEWARKKKCDFLIIACNDRFIKPFREFNKYPNEQIRKEKLKNKTDFKSENESIANQIIDFLV